MLSTTSIGMIAYMPKYLEYLGTDKPIIQLIMTIFPLTLFIFPPLLGKYSDKVQNRIFFIILGATGVVISLLLFMVTDNLVLVIFLSFIYGFFGASYRIIFTLFSEIVHNNRRLLSIYNALSTGGWFLGSQSGGIFIDIYGIENIFIFFLIFSSVNLIIVVFIKENRALILDHYQEDLNENIAGIEEKRSISHSIYYGLFFRNFGVKPIMVVLSLIMGIYITNVTVIGFLIGLNFLIQIALMLLMGHIITEKNSKFVLIFGYIFSTVAILGYILATGFFGFFIAQIFIAFSYSMFWSASVIHIAQNSTPMNKGKFMGYANTSTFLGGFIGGLLFSLLLIIFGEDYNTVMLFMMIFPLVSVISIITRYKKKTKINGFSKKDLSS
ncbi:MAG: MFS transporter [Promethearchaeota archaeon]